MMARRDLTKWHVVLWGGRTIIGTQRSGLSPNVMEPAYELRMDMAFGPKGPLLLRQLVPVGLFASFARVEIPTGQASWTKVSDLHGSDQKDTEKMLDQVEQNVAHAKAVASGIVLPKMEEKT